MQQLLTTFDGRIGRGDWWKGTLVMIGIAILFSIVVGLLFGSMSFLGRLLQFLFGIALLYPYFALGSKRLHDRGKPMLPWMAIFVGPALLLNIMQTLGIGFRDVEMMGETMQAPNALGGIVGIVAAICGIWGLVELGFLKGTAGADTHRPDPVG